MRQRRSLVVAGVIALSVRTLSADSGPRWPDKQVLDFFASHRGESIDDFLGHLRPPPPDESARALVIARLPREMSWRPSRRMTGKLAAAGPVLAYSGRTNAITIQVFDLNAAFSCLYERAVLLVSTRALDILDSDEVAALVAHEVAHDYDWQEYAAALGRGDAGRLRELELRSDGIAVLTLERVNIDPEALVSMAQKMTRWNEWLEGNTGPEPGERGDYVTRER